MTGYYRETLWTGKKFQQQSSLYRSRGRNGPCRKRMPGIVIPSAVTMKDKEIAIKDVLVRNERVFGLFDAWPLSNSYKKFVIYMSYLTVHMVTMYLDLYDAMGDLQLIMENIVNNTLITTTYLMLFLFRFSKVIKNVIVMVKREIAEDDFQNNDERHLYLSYNTICENFGKYVVKTGTCSVAVLFIIPVVKAVRMGPDAGNSTFYKTPVRVHYFIDYHHNLRTYLLAFLFQIPMLGIWLFHISVVSLLLNLILHVCAKFSILSYRIENIAENPQDSFQLKVKELVDRHVELIATTNIINSALQSMLAVELFATSIRLAVLLYAILMLPDDAVMEHCMYGLYISVVMSLLYLYSYIGEQLQYESIRVNDAYYNANWLKLSNCDQKLLLYCMCNGRRTLNFTAGKFYTFSLFGFIGIMKSCFGFVSLLRAVV